MNQPEDTSQSVTKILRERSAGKREALDELLPIVYDEMHRQAARYLRRERPNHALQTTELVHETYLKFLDQRDVHWESRTHFFAITAQIMRRILVDYARKKHRGKRGGADEHLSFDEAAVAFIVSEEKSVELIALDQALTHLETKDEQLSRVVELRYFSGLSLEETAEAMHISRATVARDWQMAKSWLHRELTR